MPDSEQSSHEKKRTSKIPAAANFLAGFQKGSVTPPQSPVSSAQPPAPKDEPKDDGPELLKDSKNDLTAQLYKSAAVQTDKPLNLQLYQPVTAQTSKPSNLSAVKSLSPQAFMQLTTHINTSRTAQVLKSITPKQALGILTGFMQLNTELQQQLNAEVDELTDVQNDESLIDKRTRTGTKKKGRTGIGYIHLSAKIQVPIHAELSDMAYITKRDMTEIAEEALLIYAELYRKAMQIASDN